MWRFIWTAIIGALAQGVLAQGMRFTPPPTLVDVEASLAQPGNVPVPLSSTNINLEIVNWSTGLTPTPERGEFLLRLRQPAPIGSILVYGNNDVSVSTKSQWTKLGGVNEKRKLRLVPLGLEAIDAVKLSAPAEKQPDNAGFRATIPFLTLLPVRATNIATTAEATASSGNAKLLVDGIAEENQTVVAEGGGSNAWIKLLWKEPQSIRGVAFFGGRDSSPIEDLALEYSANNSLRMIDGRATDAGAFRKNTLFVSYQTLTTREIQILQRDKQKPIRLGEIVVLQELPRVDPPSRSEKKP